MEKSYSFHSDSVVDPLYLSVTDIFFFISLLSSKELEK